MRHSLMAIAIMLFTMVAQGCATGGVSPSQAKGKTDRQEAARVHVELGQRYLAQGKLDIAMEKLQKALQFDPNSADAHTVIAVLYERINDQKQAEEHYRRAVELQPKLGGPNNNYGTFLCHTGQYDEAEKYFQRAVADPFYKTPDVALTNAGVCLLQGARFEQAEADFRRAIALNPNNTQALLHLAAALYRKNEYFKARAFIQRYEAQADETTPEILLLGHDIESKLGNVSAARDYARRLRQEFPDSQQARTLESSNPS